jgi:hypothetical protein
MDRTAALGRNHEITSIARCAGGLRTFNTVRGTASVCSMPGSACACVAFRADVSTAGDEGTIISPSM